MTSFLPKREQKKGSGRYRKTAFPEQDSYRPGPLAASLLWCNWSTLSETSYLDCNWFSPAKEETVIFPWIHDLNTKPLILQSLFQTPFLCAMFWQSTTVYGNLQVSCLPHIGKVNYQSNLCSTELATPYCELSAQRLLYWVPLVLLTYFTIVHCDLMKTLQGLEILFTISWLI